jgi:hypothetical protein
VAGLIQPANGRRIVTKGEDAFMLSPLLFALQYNEPRHDHHSKEFEDVVGYVATISGAR